MRDVTPSDLPARLTEKIAQRSSGCWEWTGCTQPNSYGKSYFERRTWLAHRLTYHLLVDEIPDGLVIDHLCKNTRCVNPNHLEAVTQRTNNKRSNSRSAIQARRTHCPKGHPLSGANLYVYKNHRDCSACRARRQREWQRGRHADGLPV